jgi:hypothetical protein
LQKKKIKMKLFVGAENEFFMLAYDYYVAGLRRVSGRSILMSTNAIPVVVALSLLTAGSDPRPPATMSAYPMQEQFVLAPDAAAIRCIAKRIYSEARNDPASQRGVGWVVLNRTEHSQWPSDPCKVAKQDAQFAPVGNVEPDVFIENMAVAYEVVRDWQANADDPTHGATHFSSGSDKPAWARGMRVSAKLGRHTFYK